MYDYRKGVPISPLALSPFTRVPTVVKSIMLLRLALETPGKGMEVPEADWVETFAVGFMSFFLFVSACRMHDVMDA